MDDRTGEVFMTRDAALALGVPAEHIQYVTVFTVPNGPFKGRQYVVNPNGRPGRRIKKIHAQP